MGSKLTQQVIDKICEAVKRGAYLTHAAAYAGVGAEVVSEWKKAGEQLAKAIADDPSLEPHLTEYQSLQIEFAQRILEAEGEGTFTMLDAITRAAEAGQWAAAAWRLERRYPREYGRQIQQLEGVNGKEVTFRVIHDTQDKKARDDDDLSTGTSSSD